MNEAKGYYSLIQYCPDLTRLEVANVGVILFCPERKYIRALTERSNQRIRQVFGSRGHDLVQINALKESIERRLKADAASFCHLEDLEGFIATRANEIQITPPRFVKVATEPDALLQQLLEELVVGTRPVQAAKPEEPPARRLANVFQQERLETYIRHDITIEVPAFPKPLHVPFGFKNGVFNLIQPVRFAQATESGAIGAACRSAVEGISVRKHPDPQLGAMRLVVVGDFSSEAQGFLPVVSGIFKESDVRLFTMDRVGDLVQEIRTTGKTLFDTPA